jgi:hypothetical protein
MALVFLDPQPLIQLHPDHFWTQIRNTAIMHKKPSGGGTLPKDTLPPPPKKKQKMTKENLPRQKEGGRPHAQLAVHVELEPGRGHLGQAGTKVGRQVGGQRPEA